MALDQATKILAVRHLQGEPDVNIIDGWLWLTFVLNPGAAFGLGTNATVLISTVALIVSIVVIYLAFRVRHCGWAVGLGFFGAGAMGNLIDRLFREPGPFRGHVVDFIAIPNFPVFNVADMSLNIAAVFVIFLAFRGINFDGTLERNKEPSGEQSPQADHDGASDHNGGNDNVEPT